MWKRDEAVRPTQPTSSGSVSSPPEAAAPRADVSRHAERDMVNIGKSVVIKGELNGSEDLTIEGQVEGKIELRQHILTIGPNGKIKASVFAKSIIVQGEVHGNITATEKVDIRDNGSVDGDLSAPRVAIAEGAHFRGSIDMQKQGAKPGDAKPAADVKPVADVKPASGSAGSGPSAPAGSAPPPPGTTPSR
jgi:cytoskeletal protein CcmA (bactofilin family)